MPRTPAEVVRAILDNPTNLDAVKELVAPNATYVSLSYDNPDLKTLMPWAGTSQGAAEAVVGAYARVGRCRRYGPVHRRLRPAAGRPRRIRGHGRRPARAAARPDRAGDPAHALGVWPKRLAGRRPRLVRAIVSVEPMGSPFADIPSIGALRRGLPAAPLTFDPPRARPRLSARPTRRRCACPTWLICRSPWLRATPHPLHRPARRPSPR